MKANNPTPDSLLSEVLELRSDLSKLGQRLDAVLEALPAISNEAKGTSAARANAKARGFYSVKEFAAAIGRHPQYVSDRCRGRIIRTLRGGKPYRIPLSEEARWNRL